MASVPQRSPFRYPGGKTWLVPYVRLWLKSLPRRPREFVEPFAGGAITGLTVAAEYLARRVALAEIDEGVSAVWQTVLGPDYRWLIHKITEFIITRESVVKELSQTPRNCRELAFHTILRNRVQRGGIMAHGASLVKNGENGRGVASRWYPQTLANRITAIAEMRNRIEFIKGDAFDLIQRYLNWKTAAFFVDPPYTAGGKRAGTRLYNHSQVDHERLFWLMSKAKGFLMLTYDESDEVRSLANRYALRVEEVPMKNTHHAIMHEYVITNQGSCLDTAPLELEAAYLTRKLLNRASPPQPQLQRL